MMKADGKNLMRRQHLLRFSVLLGSLILLAGPVRAIPDSSRAVTILFSGYVRGNFGPCGCQAGPTGGLARRSGFSQAYAEKSGDHIVQVDLGSYFQPLGPRSKDINHLMVEGLRRLPVRVLNLTPDDLHLWDELRELDLATSLITTNLRPRDNAKPAPARHAIVSISAAEMGTDRDLRIGFLGISEPRKVKPNSGFVGLDPLQAIAAAQAELAGKVDFVVVLANLDLDPIAFEADSLPAEIARAHDNIYAVLVAERRYMLRPPLQINNAVLLSSVERGRHLGRLTLGIDRDGKVTQIQPEFTELNDQIPEDPYFQRRQLELESLLP